MCIYQRDDSFNSFNVNSTPVRCNLSSIPPIPKVTMGNNWQ